MHERGGEGSEWFKGANARTQRVPVTRAEIEYHIMASLLATDSHTSSLSLAILGITRCREIVAKKVSHPERLRGWAPVAAVRTLSLRKEWEIIRDSIKWLQLHLGLYTEDWPRWQGWLELALRKAVGGRNLCVRSVSSSRDLNSMPLVYYFMKYIHPIDKLCPN